MKVDGGYHRQMEESEASIRLQTMQDFLALIEKKGQKPQANMYFDKYGNVVYRNSRGQFISQNDVSEILSKQVLELPRKNNARYFGEYSGRLNFIVATLVDCIMDDCYDPAHEPLKYLGNRLAVPFRALFTPFYLIYALSEVRHLEKIGTFPDGRPKWGENLDSWVADIDLDLADDE